MGQQQLLLVILVTILVGIATVVAINVFGESAEQANADAVRQDLLAAASNAQAIWTKPSQLGGAGSNFTTLSEDDGDATPARMLQQLRIPGSRGTQSIGETDPDDVESITNENGVYTLGTVTPLSIEIIAIPTSYPNQIRLEVVRNADRTWGIDIGDDGPAPVVNIP